MKSLSLPARDRTPKPADEAPLSGPVRPAVNPEPRFRTVLVEGCGWPTEACVPAARKRAVKR